MPATLGAREIAMAQNEGSAAPDYLLVFRAPATEPGVQSALVLADGTAAGAWNYRMASHLPASAGTRLVGSLALGATIKPRRKMGNDRIVIADDFDAPLSPEEEELFGL
jgi:hypothetical protein